MQNGIYFFKNFWYNINTRIEGVRMGKVIAMVNQKGGVGKTTTSINLAASLGILSKKVLMIDLDPQGNATTGVGINKGDVENSIYEVLIGQAVIEDAIIKTKYKNMSIIPAYTNLAGIDIVFINKERKAVADGQVFDKTGELKKSVLKIKDNYDYIIIDCPPSLGVLTTNALAASDSVIIPVQCEFFALEGVMQLMNTIMLAKKKINPNLEIEGVLLTMLYSRTNLGLEVVENIRGFFKERVYDTIIPRLVRLSEAPSHGKPIAAYDPTSKGTLAYLNLAKEVIEHNERRD